MRKKGMLCMALAFMICAFVSPARGANLTLTTGGRVTVELLFSDAAFRNTLSVASPSVAAAITGCKLEPADGLSGVRILSEKASQRGCRVELDADPATPGIQGFAVGATFEFRLCAQTDSDPQCEFVWSSNSGSNPDSFDHVRTTPIRPVEFPGQIFQLAWEDLENGGDNDFNDLIAVVRVAADSDGDSLWDDWEQFGIDTDGNGTIDLDLASLGANPRHKDIFMEIDFMDCATAGGDCAAMDNHTHQPKAAAINAVVQSFANAPVTNPDGVTGISLHANVGNAIPHQNVLNIPGLCFAGGAGIGNFDTVKADPANFGPTNPRRFAFHYVLFTHMQHSTNTSSGCAELPGNDFQVSLGGFNAGLGDQDGDGLRDANVGTVQQQAGTLMHEFGHNLNLFHGGDVGDNRKPNYISVMNYEFQLPGIPPTDPDGAGPMTARIDYSPQDLNDLNENSLVESAGIGDGTDNTRYFCPGTPATRRLGAGNAAIDWNCDGDTTDNPVPVALDINNSGASSVLTGFDDWENIKYDFQNTGDFEDGEHSFSERVEEIDAVQAETTFASAKDSFLRAGLRNTNEGANNFLSIQQGQRTAIAFDVSDAPKAGVTHATLVLTVAKQARNWGSGGRDVSVHRLSELFTEGNGSNSAPKTADRIRGSGPGVTWNCATDEEVGNQRTDCTANWHGGLTVAVAATDSVSHTNKLKNEGTVEWDVTEDVLAAIQEGQGEVAWLVKKEREGSPGSVTYYSKEGSLSIVGDLSVAPRLVLSFD
jgi:hypothetical protein